MKIQIIHSKLSRKKKLLCTVFNIRGSTSDQGSENTGSALVNLAA